jgi:hypothetical protein
MQRANRSVDRRLDLRSAVFAGSGVKAFALLLVGVVVLILGVLALDYAAMARLREYGYDQSR